MFRHTLAISVCRKEITQGPVHVAIVRSDAGGNGQGRPGTLGSTNCRSC